MHPLRPDPPIQLTDRNHDLIEKANRALDRLGDTARGTTTNPAIRLKGEWLGWLRFFLEGVQQTARQATDIAGRMTLGASPIS